MYINTANLQIGILFCKNLRKRPKTTAKIKMAFAIQNVLFKSELILISLILFFPTFFVFDYSVFQLASYALAPRS